MNLKPVIMVCSADEDAVRRISAAVQETMRVIRAVVWLDVENQMVMYSPVTVIVDVRCDDVYQRLDDWSSRYPDIPLIAMGRERSERMRYLERVDVFATADLEDDYREWQKLLRLSTRHHRMLNEMKYPHDHEKNNHRGGASADSPLMASQPPARKDGSSIFAHVAGAFRHFEHVDLLLDRAVEGLAAAAHSTRAGLFTRDEVSGKYRLRAGIRYLKETAEAEYEPHDPLVRWFERHAHMITRSMAVQLPEPAQRQLMSRSLELAGAELMAPLHARGRLLGWFFVGCRSTGQAYDIRDLEELSLAADYLSMLLENALLYHEVTVQKKLAETLLHALPVGIAAVDGSGVVRWFSTSAEVMLDRRAEHVVGQPVESLGSRLADTVHRVMRDEAPPPTLVWEEKTSRRYLKVETLPLGRRDENLGAVLMIQDLTSIRQMQEKQDQMERTAFWTDLAAGLSHEIRNPLVAIRTFAQLLPERYQDEDFREEFSKLVSHEVDRLNGIIDQINGFAHPPEPSYAHVDIRTPLQNALRKIFPESPARIVRIKSDLEGNLPLVRGDERALTDCFAHIFQNAFEAIGDRKDAAISYAVHQKTGPGNENMIEISITDNGRGIPQDAHDKVFSPFYTTKARGMGLGLPIAKRTVVDHNGHIAVDSNMQGTSVIVQLPTNGKHEREGSVA
ncbi:MAG TPA: ATP-binding protein [Kiritimatiellia bacterium]|nr:ATP-binding protein [Kiritimatiellia bacterium]